MPKIVSVLRQRHILLLWSGQLLSAFGDRFFEIAIVWLSVQIIGSEAGFILASGSIARLIAGLLGGAFADRWDRRKTMIAVDVLRALAILSLPVAALTAEISLMHMAVVSAVIGALSSIFDPALQASLPNLISKSQELQAGNALLDVTSRMARIFAPGLAGLLIAFIPIEQFFTLDAATFLISAVALLAIGRNFKWQAEPTTSQTAGLRGIIAEIQGAMALTYQNKAVFWSLISYIPANIIWAGGIMVGLALLADGPLSTDVRGYSFLITAYGIGSVISNVIVGSIPVKRRALLLFVGVIIFGLGIGLLGLVNSYTAALVAMFIAATGTPMSDLMILLMIQEEFPADQVGKIFSLRLTISSVGYSAGLLFAAYFFQWIDIQAGLLWLGILGIGVGVTGIIRFWNYSHSRVGFSN